VIFIEVYIYCTKDLISINSAKFHSIISLIKKKNKTHVTFNCTIILFSPSNMYHKMRKFYCNKKFLIM